MNYINDLAREHPYLLTLVLLVALVIFVLVFASETTTSKIDDIIATSVPVVPMSVGEWVEHRKALDYARVKASRRIRVTRVWTFDPDHVETVEGEPLAFSVSPDGTGWVTIKKDDGHVLSIPHTVPSARQALGMTIVEARFV